MTASLKRLVISFLPADMIFPKPSNLLQIFLSLPSSYSTRYRLRVIRAGIVGRRKRHVLIFVTTRLTAVASLTVLLNNKDVGPPSYILQQTAYCMTQMMQQLQRDVLLWETSREVSV